MRGSRTFKIVSGFSMCMTAALLVGSCGPALANPAQGQLVRAAINLGRAWARVTHFNEGDPTQGPAILEELARARTHLIWAEAQFAEPWATDRRRSQTLDKFVGQIDVYPTATAGASKVGKAGYIYRIYFSYREELPYTFRSDRPDTIHRRGTCDYFVFTVGFAWGQAEIAAAIGPTAWEPEFAAIQDMRLAINSGTRAVADVCCGFYPPQDGPGIWEPFRTSQPRAGQQWYRTMEARLLDIVDRAAPPPGLRCAPPEPTHAAPHCEVAGLWMHQTTGLAAAQWEFVPTGARTYRAQEHGLDNANGTATVNGRRLRIEWTSPRGYAGVYEWDLDEQCAAGRGRLAVTRGNTGVRDSQIRRATSSTGVPPGPPGPSPGISPGTPAVATPLPAGSLEQGMNRPGGDYRGFDLQQPWPELCRNTCANEGQCRAWTYVKPGVQGQRARCWLKTSVPPPVPSQCCVSGVKARESASPSTAPVQPPPRARQYFVYYKTDEWTCCRATQDMNVYPFERKGEVPHPIQVGEVHQEDARIKKLSGQFSSAEAAKQWLCGNHQVRRMQAWGSNTGRVAGVLVSNLPCPATIQ